MFKNEKLKNLQTEPTTKNYEQRKKSNNEKNETNDEKKYLHGRCIANYEKVIQHAPYPLERVEVPFEGVELQCSNASPRIEFTKRCDKPLELFAFQGEWKTHCTLLGGTVNDLSVITRRGKCSARIEILELRDTIAIEKAAGDDCVILIAAGAAKVLAQGRAEDLGRFDSIAGDRGAYASYSLSKAGLAATRVVVVRLSQA